MDMSNLTNELIKWGVNNSTAINTDSVYCEKLYTTLTANYPCMKEGICTPFNYFPFMFLLVMLFLIMFYCGVLYSDWKKNRETFKKENERLKK